MRTFVQKPTQNNFCKQFFDNKLQLTNQSNFFRDSVIEQKVNFAEVVSKRPKKIGLGTKICCISENDFYPVKKSIIH